MIRGAVVVPSSSPTAAGRATPPRRSRLVWSIPVGVAMLIAVLVGGTLTSWFDVSPGPVAKPSATTRPVEVVKLRVGDCFDVVLASVEAYSGLTQRACTEAHEYEVYWTGAMPAGYYPSDETFEAFYHANCLDAFGEYVGEVWTETRLDSFWMVPDADDWAAGYRSVQCSVCDPANPRLTYSLKGAAPSGNSAIPV
jgi:hypothetical protein